MNPDRQPGVQPRRGVPPVLDALSSLVLRGLVVFVGIAVAVAILARLRLVVLPVIFALILSTFLAPPTRLLKRRGLPPALAAGVVLVVAIVAVAAPATVVVPAFASQFAEVGQRAEEGITAVEEWLRRGPLDVAPGTVNRLGDEAQRYLRDNWGGITSKIVSGTLVALELVSGLVLTLVVLFFFVKDDDRIVSWALAQIPEARRDDVRAVASRAWEALSGFMRGAAIDGLVEAVIVGVALAVLGVPLALPLAAVTFFAGFFPVVGAFFAGGLAALVTLVTAGLGDALVVAAVFAAIQQLQNNLLEPLILGRAVRLHPLVILLSLTAGAVVAGIVGAFLAVPAAAVTAAAVGELRRRRLLQPPSPEERASAIEGALPVSGSADQP